MAMIKQASHMAAMNVKLITKWRAGNRYFLKLDMTFRADNE